MLLSDKREEVLEYFKKYTEGKTLNELEIFFSEGEHHPIHKWLHYFDVYDRYFSKFRDREILMVEVGVFKGGSLDLWKNYFGPKVKIIGVDIDPECKKFESDQIHIEIGSQEDRNFWKDFRNRYPKADIFLDDGGHTMKQQIVTFEEMYGHVANNGIYMCEDLHTSYWGDYQGGYRNPGSFIEYSKHFIDRMNAWYIGRNQLPVDDFTKTAYSLAFYDSMLVIEKKEREVPPVTLMI
ncbi:MAG: class I SAM-dependent methyltransferase [Planctomycetia bacterium]|nr:class I SAM-dependent methyltransferase [Planctomycetia bacterium]